MEELKLWVWFCFEGLDTKQIYNSTVHLDGAFIFLTLTYFCSLWHPEKQRKKKFSKSWCLSASAIRARRLKDKVELQLSTYSARKGHKVTFFPFPSGQCCSWLNLTHTLKGAVSIHNIKERYKLTTWYKYGLHIITVSNSIVNYVGHSLINVNEALHFEESL